MRIDTFLYKEQKSKFKIANIRRKIIESEYPGNMHIDTLCPKYLKCFNYFRAAV